MHIEVKFSEEDVKQLCIQAAQRITGTGLLTKWSVDFPQTYSHEASVITDAEPLLLESGASDPACIGQSTVRTGQGRNILLVNGQEVSLSLPVAGDDKQPATGIASALAHGLDSIGE